MKNTSRFIHLGHKIMPEVLLILVLLIFTSCGTTGKNLRADFNDLDELQNFVENKKFEIENEWAGPLNGNQINLIGNPNYVRVKGDTVDLFLPYFGVRHTGGNYGGRNGGIKYKGVPEEMHISNSGDDQSISIRFEAEKDQEDYDIVIRIFPNGKTSTYVNSSERTGISYRGFLKKLLEEEEEQVKQ